jgi:hypothetical protein
VKEKLWTVARYPDGSWGTGGSPNDADYAHCEVYQVPASDRDSATKKAKLLRKGELRKAGRAVPNATNP